MEEVQEAGICGVVIQVGDDRIRAVQIRSHALIHTFASRNGIALNVCPSGRGTWHRAVSLSTRDLILRTPQSPESAWLPESCTLLPLWSALSRFARPRC